MMVGCSTSYDTAGSIICYITCRYYDAPQGFINYRGRIGLGHAAIPPGGSFDTLHVVIRILPEVSFVTLHVFLMILPKLLYDTLGGNFD